MNIGDLKETKGLVRASRDDTKNTCGLSPFDPIVQFGQRVCDCGFRGIGHQQMLQTNISPESSKTWQVPALNQSQHKFSPTYSERAR